MKRGNTVAPEVDTAHGKLREGEEKKKKNMTVDKKTWLSVCFN